MRYFFGIYGYEITRPLSLNGLYLTPRVTPPNDARKLATSRSEFNLTGIGEITSSGRASLPESQRDILFDLAAALTFCQQQWVIVSRIISHPDNVDPQRVLQSFPDQLDVRQERPSPGAVLISDFFDPDARCRFLDLCLDKLRDNQFEEATYFRKAFYRNVEIWRFNRQLLDVTYYMIFSALEILARRHSGDYTSSIAQVLTPFLRDECRFSVEQDKPSVRERSVQTYVHLRNALFHNGEFEVTFNENGYQITLKLMDYFDKLERLLSDVLLRVLGYNDPHINWNRWLDRMPFGS